MATFKLTEENFAQFIEHIDSAKAEGIGFTRMLIRQCVAFGITQPIAFDAYLSLGEIITKIPDVNTRIRLWGRIKFPEKQGLFSEIMGLPHPSNCLPKFTAGSLKGIDRDFRGDKLREPKKFKGKRKS